MSHSCKTFKFETETEAKKFADTERANKFPNEDKYVSGPFYMDENVIFKTMPWANTGKTWWQVTVELYN